VPRKLIAVGKTTLTCWTKHVLVAFSITSVTSAEERSWLPAADVHPGIPYCNTRRTGYTPQELTPPYCILWAHAVRHKPRPAWKEPAWEPQRIDFDYAYAVSGQGDTVYYASSSDHALHALDLATGREKWGGLPMHQYALRRSSTAVVCCSRRTTATSTA